MTKPFATQGRRAPYSQLGDWVAVSGVPPQSVHAYWALEAMTFRRRDDAGEEVDEVDSLAKPSRETLADLLGFSRPQSVDPYLDALVDIGAIDKIAQPGYPNRYVVHQTPPDDYEGPHTMGQWHKRRAARKKAEKQAAEAKRAAKKTRSKPSAAAIPATTVNAGPQVDGCAPQRTSPDRTCAPQRTGGVRSSAQGVCAPAHTKEEALKDPSQNPPTPPPSGGNPDLPTDEPPTSRRCDTHGITGCRACGLSVRSKARAEREQSVADLMAAERAGRACRMCTSDGTRADKTGTRWIRVVRGTQTPLTPYVLCDHTTPHDHVLADLQDDDAAALTAAALAQIPMPSDHVPLNEVSPGYAEARASADAAMARAKAKKAGGRDNVLPDPWAAAAACDGVRDGRLDGAGSTSGLVVDAPSDVVRAENVAR